MQRAILVVVESGGDGLHRPPAGHSSPATVHELPLQPVEAGELVRKVLRQHVPEMPECLPLNYQDIREWAVRHGFTVGDRGRLPSAVLTAYFAEHPEDAPARPNVASSGGDGARRKKATAPRKQEG